MEEHTTQISLARKAMVTALLALLGLAANYLNLSVCYNVNFIFGSIFSIVAVGFLGLGWGVAVALAASCYSYWLWNHPYAIIIFTAESLWLGIALKRGRQNILLIDALYWLCLGIPLVVLFYGGVMGLGAQSTAIIAMKQPLNGVFNALMAPRCGAIGVG